MENLRRVSIAATCCIALVLISVAGNATETQRRSFSWLDMLDLSYGPTESRCGLGFVGFGSPVVVTRVSSWTKPDGLTEADRLLAVNGEAVRSEFDLNAALKAFGPDDHVTLSVLRGDVPIRIDVVCQDTTPVLQARADALDGAAEGRWDDCVSATYEEEFHWGGANSESAGLRLWCHQAKFDRASLSRIGAHLIYEHTTLLLDELKHVPGWIKSNREGFVGRIRQIDDGGHTALSDELQTKLAFIDKF